MSSLQKRLRREAAERKEKSKEKITQSYESQKEGTRPGTKRMESGKRGEKSHRTLEQARAMSGPGNYEGQEHRKKYRTELGKLRKEYGLKKGDGKEVSHKKDAKAGGSHTKANTEVKSRTENRTKPRGGSAKKGHSTKR